MASRVTLLGKRVLGQPVRRELRQLLAGVAHEHERSGGIHVNFISDAEMRRLHRDFLGDDTPTDVITFPADPEDAADGEPLLGEIAVSVDTAAREAAARGVPLEHELCLYALHGVLHLVGFDDIDPADRRRMRAAERRYMRRLTWG